MLHCNSFLCMLDSRYVISKYFYPSLSVPFVLCYSLCGKVLYLMWPHCHLPNFIVSVLGIRSAKSLPWPILWSFPPHSALVQQVRSFRFNSLYKVDPSLCIIKSRSILFSCMWISWHCSEFSFPHCVFLTLGHISLTMYAWTYFWVFYSVLSIGRCIFHEASW